MDGYEQEGVNGGGCVRYCLRIARDLVAQISFANSTNKNRLLMPGLDAVVESVGISIIKARGENCGL